MPAADETQPEDPFATLLPLVRVEGNAVDSESFGTRFRIARPLAKGGLGEIFVAIDVELNREVAVKTIQLRFADDPSSRVRFLREAAVTGSLEHPGIIPIYGLSYHSDGRPYYAMRLVRGVSLHEAIIQCHQSISRKMSAGEGAVKLRQLLSRFLDVCNAIAYAHSRGIIHRDIKPQNIMLGTFGETLVVDWGLAKFIGHSAPQESLGELGIRLSEIAEAGLTTAGSSVGTPQYMSPEQAEGKLETVGTSSDVYSLGATLYCILTGRAPFGGSNTAQILNDIVLGRLVAPGDVRRDIPRALESICLKAMALKPGDRYNSPRAIADDLENWLADRQVLAHFEHPLYRLLRWVRHNKALVAGAAIFTVTAITSLVLNDYGYRGANIVEIILSFVILTQFVLLIAFWRVKSTSNQRVGEVAPKGPNENIGDRNYLESN